VPQGLCLCSILNRMIKQISLTTSSNRNILGTPAFATLPVLVLGIHIVRGSPKTGNPRQPGTIKGCILITCKVGKACIERPCLVRYSWKGGSAAGHLCLFSNRILPYFVHYVGFKHVIKNRSL